MKCHSKIKQTVGRSLLCLTTIISILLLIPFEVKAQLTPWDHTNQVFIDLSVINDTSDLRRISPFARVNPLHSRKNRMRSSSLRDIDSQLLEPPKQRPKSSFLLKRPIKAITSRPNSTFKLIPPNEYRKRSNAAKTQKALNKFKQLRKVTAKKRR